MCSLLAEHESNESLKSCVKIQIIRSISGQTKTRIGFLN